MTDDPSKLPVFEVSRRALLEGMACAQGGAMIMLLMKQDTPPQQTAVAEVPFKDPAASGR